MAIETRYHVAVFSALDHTYGLIDGTTRWPDCLDALVKLAGVDACGLLLYDCGRGRSHLVGASGREFDDIDPAHDAAIDESLWRAEPGVIWLPAAAAAHEHPAHGDPTRGRPDSLQVCGYSVLDRDSAHILYLEFHGQPSDVGPGSEASRLLENILPHLHRACRLHRSMTGDDLVTFASPNIVRPKTPAGMPIELRLRRRFRLSKAEARVATLLADGLAPRMIADRLNVSIHTVRSQLQAIFNKTDTSRQAELTSLLLRETEIPRAICQTQPMGIKSRESSSCL